MHVSDLEPPRVLAVVDFESPLAGAIGLDSGAVCCDEVHAGWLGQVWARGWHNANFGPGINQEVCAGEGVFDME